MTEAKTLTELGEDYHSANDADKRSLAFEQILAIKNPSLRYEALATLNKAKENVIAVHLRTTEHDHISMIQALQDFTADQKRYLFLETNDIGSALRFYLLRGTPEGFKAIFHDIDPDYINQSLAWAKNSTDTGYKMLNSKALIKPSEFAAWYEMLNKLGINVEPLDKPSFQTGTTVKPVELDQTEPVVNTGPRIERKRKFYGKPVGPKTAYRKDNYFG